jgi:hypothetical protein
MESRQHALYADGQSNCFLYPLSLSASTASGLSALKPAAMAGNGVGERLNS